MEENKLTAKEIFVQLTILQKQLTENSQTSLHRLDDAITSIGEEGENEARYAQIAEICEVFKTREQTLLKMLEMYEKMYDDVQGEETRRVNLIKSAFDTDLAMIKDSDMESSEKMYSFEIVTEKIGGLVEQVLSND